MYPGAISSGPLKTNCQTNRNPMSRPDVRGPDPARRYRNEPTEPGMAAPSSLQTMLAHMTIPSATSQPSIACGPPSADMSSGIVMNGPMPIMFVMFSAVACSRPKRRVIVDGGCVMESLRTAWSQTPTPAEAATRDRETIGARCSKRLPSVGGEGVGVGARGGVGILAIAPLQKLHWRAPDLEKPQQRRQCGDDHKGLAGPRLSIGIGLRVHGMKIRPNRMMRRITTPMNATRHSRGDA